MGSTLTVDNIVGATTAANVKMPAGHVLQVVEASGSGIIYFGNSTSSYTDLITLNITPKYSNSLIAVHCFQTLNTSSGNWGTRVRRTTGTATTVISGEGQSNTGRLNFVGFKFDSPASTSQVTYVLQGIAGGGGTDSNLYTVNNPTGGGMIAMEIAQ